MSYMVGVWQDMLFNTTFNNASAKMMVVSFIGGGNRRKALTCRKSLTNFITECCILYTSPWMGFELTTLVVKGTDCTGSCKSNNHTITTPMAPVYMFFGCLRSVYCVPNVAIVCSWMIFSNVYSQTHSYNKILHKWLQNAWNHLLFEQSREWLHIYTFNIYRCKFKYRE
jgi:hypothetical protein